MQLVSDALDGFVQGTFSGSVTHDISLVQTMTALHIAHQANKSCLLWILNLIFCIPPVLKSLRSTASPQQLVSADIWRCNVHVHFKYMYFTSILYVRIRSKKLGVPLYYISNTLFGCACSCSL